MAGGPEIQISRLLDERGLSPFQVKLLIWSILLSLIDGYDIGAIAFAAPHLVASWGVPRSALGPVLSASNIGVLFGSAIFGKEHGFGMDPSPKIESMLPDSLIQTSREIPIQPSRNLL